MHISNEGIDSKALRWSGLALAGFIAAAMLLGAPSTPRAPTPQLSASAATDVRLGQLSVPVCGERC